MIRRHREVLNYIYNAEGFISGNNLAKMCGVSVRTIQLDIKAINSLLSEYGIIIKSAVKHGYYIDGKSKELLKERNIIREVIDYKYINDPPNTPFERQMYLILRLTINEIIYLDELENKFFVSESTINKDMIGAAKWLKENLNIHMKYSLSKKAELIVSEKEKRNIISWVLAYKLNASTLEKQWKYLFDGNGFIENLRKIYSITESETKRYGYYLSGHSLQLLSIEISVAAALSTMNDEQEENNKESFQKPVILAIAERLEENVNIKLSKSELLNIQEYFMSMQFVSGTDIKNIETEDSKEIISEFMTVLKKKYQVDLTGYPEVKEKLILYVAPMINRIKFRHCIGNRINENVSKNHPYEYEMASEITAIVKNKLDLYVPIVDIAYITVYLAAIYKLWSKKLNAVIICDYDESVISYIRNRIVSQLEDKIRLTGCFTYRQLISGKQEMFKDVDFIITTSTVADSTDIPFVQISPVMEQKDFSKLLESVMYLSRKT